MAIFKTGTNGADTINMGDSDDKVLGLGGPDHIAGGGGNDTVWGGDGDDFIIGEDGTDLLWGGKGNDEINGGLGNDTINGGLNNDTIDGGIGNDWLVGEQGKDLLYGNEGNDLLMGGAELDQLRGGAGNDTLVGGADGDVLTGDAGNDVFKYNFVNEGGDIISDFEVGHDKIDLSAIDAKKFVEGDQAFEYVDYDPATPLSAGQVTSYKDGNYTVIEGAVDDLGAADFRIDLKGDVQLSASDFNFGG